MLAPIAYPLARGTVRTASFQRLLQEAGLLLQRPHAAVISDMETRQPNSAATMHVNLPGSSGLSKSP